MHAIPPPRIPVWPLAVLFAVALGGAVALW